LSGKKSSSIIENARTKVTRSPFLHLPYIYSSVGKFFRGLLRSFRLGFRNFKFGNLLPNEFLQIREMFHVSNEDYIRAFQGTSREKFSEGRSGGYCKEKIDFFFVVPCYFSYFFI
jgi:hypothetical protein